MTHRNKLFLRFLSASRPGEFIELFPPSLHGGLVPSSDLDQWVLADNGSLILMSARPEKAGRYLCQVSNGIGQDLTQVVNFTVKGKEGDLPFTNLEDLPPSQTSVNFLGCLKLRVY